MYPLFFIPCPLPILGTCTAICRLIYFACIVIPGNAVFFLLQYTKLFTHFVLTSYYFSDQFVAIHLKLPFFYCLILHITWFFLQLNNREVFEYYLFCMVIDQVLCCWFICVCSYIVISLYELL